MKSYHKYDEVPDNTFNINIFIESKKNVNIDDMIFIIEDKLMVIFKDFYNENIEGKLLSSLEYAELMSKVLAKINNLKVYVNDKITFVPIINKIKNFNLLYSFKKITF